MDSPENITKVVWGALVEDQNILAAVQRAFFKYKP